MEFWASLIRKTSRLGARRARGAWRRGVLLFVFVLVWTGARFAAAAAEPLPANFMTVDQIKPGMIGEGRTVFHGFKIEPFKVEILGVEHNAMAGGDMILAQISGPMLENHGVVAGMSGSPIYIDGKLIGALAYGWTFSYKPYCGITPIAQMWSVWQSIGQPGLSDPGARGATSPGGEATWDWRKAWEEYQARSEEGGAVAPEAGGFKPTLPALRNEPGAMKPLGTPLYLSGASPQGETRIRNFFASRGVEVLSAGTLAGSASAAGDALSTTEPGPPLEGGSSLGIPILSGDLSVSAIGTVTYVQGEKLIAFGHPMFNDGGTAAPLAAAYIFGFLQSYDRSLKLGEVRDVRGTIEQDRQFAIGGRIGPAPPRVPITVEIAGGAASRPRTYHFSCWKNHAYIPSMTTDAFLEAYTASVAQGGKLTATSQYTITLADGRRIVKHFDESADGLPIADTATSMERDLFLLQENIYREADVRSIEISTRVKAGLREDSLFTAETDHTNYLAGDAVRIRARFRPWRGEEYTRDFSLKLPADLKPGAYIVHLADSGGQQRIEQTHTPGRFDPKTFDDVVSLIRTMDYVDNEVRVYLFEPSLGLDVRGQSLDGMPTTMQNLVHNTTPPQIMQQAVGRELSVESYMTPAPVTGTYTMLIQVVDHFDE